MTTLSRTPSAALNAAAALIAAGTLNPTNEQVRQHLGGGSLSHISPVMRVPAPDGASRPLSRPRPCRRSWQSS